MALNPNNRKPLNLSGAKEILDSDERPALNLSGAQEILKKKDISISSEQATVSESNATVISSGESKSDLPLSSPSKYKEGSMAWNQEKLKQNVSGYTSIFDKFQETQKVSDERQKEIALEVEAESKDEGIFNNLIKYGKRTANALADTVTATLTLGTNGESPIRFEEDTLKSEKETARKELLKEAAIAKAKKEPVPEISKEAITAKAKEIAIAKRIKSESKSQVRDFLQDIPDADKTDLTKFAVQEYATIKEDEKLNLKKQNVLQSEIDLSLSKINDLNKTVSQYKNNPEAIPDDLKSEYQSELKKYQVLVSDAIQTQKEFISNEKDLGDMRENVDIFKRNYGKLRNFVNNVDATIGDISAGVFGAVDYANKASEYVFGETEMTRRRGENAKAIYQSLKSDADEARAEIMKPLSVDDIENASDFGSWFSNTVLANQIPIYGLVATGAPGIAAIGGYSTGEKFEAMQEEMKSGEQNYSDEQMLGIPAGFGVTETASAMVDRLLLGNASRVIRSATAPERTMMAKSIWDSAKNIGGASLKGGLLEGLDESGTQVAQNILDKYAGDKNIQLLNGVKDAGTAGTVMGMLLPFGSNLVAEAIKPFSTDTKIQKASAQILAYESQLDNKEISDTSRKTIESQLDKTKSDVKTLLEKKIKNIGNLTDAQFSEVMRLEKAQANIKNQVREVLLDDALSEDMKKQLTGDLKTEFEANDQRRIDLVERGGNRELNKLGDEELIIAKDQAARKLMKELNPDGTKSITLTDEQITKKAGEMLAEKNAKREAKENPVVEESAPIVNETINTNIENETIPNQNPIPDGNVQPDAGIVEQNRNAVEENTETENVSESVDTAAATSEVQNVKEVTVGKGAFSGTFSIEITPEGKQKITKKDGTEIPEFVERKIKQRGVDKPKTKIVKNPTYAKIWAEANNTLTENQINEERKKNYNEALNNTEPTTPYEVAARAIANGQKINRESVARETGDGKNRTWVTGLGNNESAPSVEVLAEQLAEANPQIEADGTNFRDAILEVIGGHNNIDDVRDGIIENYQRGNDQYYGLSEEEQISAYKGSLSEEELSLFESKQFDDYVDSLPENEKVKYYKQEYAKQLESLDPDQQRAIHEQYELDEQQRQGLSSANQGDEVSDSGIGAESEESGRQSEQEIDDEAESATQGMSFNNDNRRDLTGKGRIRDLLSRQRKFRKLWNNTFKSNAGLDTRVAETFRSRNREISAFTDALDYETGLFKNLLDKVRKSNPKDYIKNSLAINDYLAGDSNAVPFLNTEQKAQLDYFRERIDILSETILDKLDTKLTDLQTRLASATSPVAQSSISGSVERTQNLIDTIRNNKGTYLNRSYQIFVDDSYSEIITEKNNEISIEGRDKIKNAVDYLVREEGYSKKNAEEYIADYLDGIRKAKNDFSFISSGKADAPFLKKRKDLPVEFRELLGEAKDPIYNFVNTVYKLSNYVANLEYQDRMRTTLLDTDIGKLAPEQGYTKLTSDGDGWQTLSDVYVPKDVAEALNEMAPLARVDSGFYQAWIKIAAATKIGKTILSPTTTFRNLYSGVFLGVNAGHFFLSSPKYTAQAFNQGLGTDRSQTKLKSERQKLIKLGVLNDGGNAGEVMAIVNDFSKETDRMVKTNKFQYSFDVLKKLYAFGDDFYKTAGFYIEKERFMKTGMNEADAEVKSAERIRNSYPTYSYIPKNFQRLRRLPVVGTFVSFPYEMVRTTKNNLLFIKEDFEQGRKKMAAQRAAGLIIGNATLFGLSAFTRSLIGFDDEDDDAVRDMLPQWQKNSKLIYTGTKNGKPTFVDGTALFPSEVVMKPLSILFEDRAGRDKDDKIQEAVYEAISPYIGLDISFKTIMGLINNQNEYGEPIYKGDNIAEGAVNSPDKITNYYLKQAGPGVYNNISEFMRANEIMPETFGDKFASYGKEYTNKEAVLGLLGFRISTINYSNGITSFGYGVKDEYDIDRKEMVAKMKGSEKLTVAEVAKIASDYKKTNEEALEKIGNIITAGTKLGMTQVEIKDALIRSGYSKGDALLLTLGGKPAPKPVSAKSESNQKEKLTVSYGKDKAKPLIDVYDHNLSLLEIELRKINEKDIQENSALLKKYSTDLRSKR